MREAEEEKKEASESEEDFEVSKEDDEFEIRTEAIPYPVPTMPRTETICLPDRSCYHR